jgi:acetoin utilization deacetylase AcuC-like enzyme
MRDYAVERVLVIDLDVHQVWTLAAYFAASYFDDDAHKFVLVHHFGFLMAPDIMP